MQIREAVLDDLNTLKQFEQDVITYERPFALNLKEDPITYYNIENLIENNDAQLLVAIIDNKLVGCGYALIKDSVKYKKPDQYAYLGFMYVSPEYRGKGINGTVTQHLIAWAATRNITEIQLDVYADNASAIKAYKKVGFKPDLLKMRLTTENG
ncbi:GNAT family N-acetyltransferase [Aureibaculum sp. A20]|uniref:GNAT family N-acetyltransferase n=1 Tax=Aureibaculum flavum TaxID=2795986 RepID=A0ABS0WX57_9FLAO|nr:GNAT family N-acetyltransferase [Aureibaculum flavum]MBJ2176448.1 GNAT family N-acetyltransferase [Aureibaculum flavum]